MEVREDIHSRTPLLFFAAFLCLTRGLGYTFAGQVKTDLPDGLSNLGAFVGIWVYGVLWLCAAVALVYLMVSRRQSYALMVFSAFPALVWAAAYLVGWIAEPDRLWTAAFLYWCASGLIFWAGMTRPKGGWRG